MTWLRRLALLAVPGDWRETVRADLEADLVRDDARGLSTARYIAEAVRVGLTLRWGDRRVPSPAWLISQSAPFRLLPFELRLAARSLRRTPWFTATVVGVMTLVLTMATSVFAIVDGVLFRPLPYPDSERLFVVEPGFDFAGYTGSQGASMPDLEHWKAAATDVVFSAFRAARWSGYGAGINDESTAGMASIDSEFFDVLGVSPAIGGFAPGDFDVREPADRAPITPVVITWDLWHQRFDGDPDVIGRTEANLASPRSGFRVVGVMPEGFWFPSYGAEVQFLRPLDQSPESVANRDYRGNFVLIRIPPSTTVDRARDQIEAGMRNFAAALPDRGPKPASLSEAAWRIRGPFDQATLVPLRRSVAEQSRAFFTAVFAAAIVLVLLGALNASALLAARAEDRDREFRMRRALGASRLAAGRMVVVEVVLLFALAASLALLLAPPLLRFALPLLPTGLTLLKPWGADSFDWRVPAFTTLLALALALQASVWPMSRAMRAAPSSAGTVGRTSERRHRGRSLVIGVQVGGAFALSVIGALLVGSLLSVYGQGLSIRTDGVVFVEASLPAASAARRSDREARVSSLLDLVGRVPGVRDAALVSGQALVGPAPDTAWGFFFVDEPAVPGLGLRQPYTHAVTGSYYRILQPEIVAGRVPSAREVDAGEPLALVSESLARAQWPDESPIGQTLRDRNGTPFEVIGVVRDVPWISWDGHSRMAYGSATVVPGRGSTVTLIIDGGGRPGVTRDVIDALRGAIPPVGVSRAGNLIDVFVDTVRARRFRSWLFGGFAAAALFAVGVGILGLLAMSTARRTREVGIRQALGATPGSIVRLFVREQMRPVLVGLVIGAIVSTWAVGFVESYLFGVTTTDARVWGAAVVLILVTAGAGALIPSLRASTTDPTIALRAD